MLVSVCVGAEAPFLGVQGPNFGGLWHYIEKSQKCQNKPQKPKIQKITKIEKKRRGPTNRQTHSDYVTIY